MTMESRAAVVTAIWVAAEHLKRADILPEDEDSVIHDLAAAMQYDPVAVFVWERHRRLRQG